MYLSYARNAFEIILENIDLKNNEIILVPSFNCDAIYHPLKVKKIKYKFYKIDDSFKPDWDQIENMNLNSVKAILMVNYFGQLIDVSKFKNFSRNNKLLLIEDNSHGYLGNYNNQVIGRIGDFGFSSPRKILNINAGAILYDKSTNINLNKFYSLRRNTYINLKLFIFILLRHLPRFREKIKHMIKKKPNFNDVRFLKEPFVGISKIDPFSKFIIKNSNWKKISFIRRENWKLWSIFLKKNGFTLIWEESFENSCPWLIPAYCKNVKHREYWLNRSWNEGLGIITWPTLPEEAIDEETANRWLKFICVNLDHKPPVK